ncbi:Gmad2 immunoglobulin-like domain-containing protein [Micromonospora sp. NPDC047134]|uniref:Gmad2 immunoglobulin-like domain-containing protein n=1 Tax=Micromonospora sp. NPDC047134 TaxID=3154340 RepID=UPI0033ECE9F5
MVESTNVGPHGLADGREETAMRISRTLAALTVTCVVLLTTAATTATAGTTTAATGEPYCAITWATAFTTATCGTGCRGGYRLTLRYRLAREQPGTIEAYEVSAVDGSPTKLVSVPVTLTATR